MDFASYEIRTRLEVGAAGLKVKGNTRTARAVQELIAVMEEEELEARRKVLRDEKFVYLGRAQPLR